VFIRVISGSLLHGSKGKAEMGKTESRNAETVLGGVASEEWQVPRGMGKRLRVKG
jgi:hypothetical protein